MIVPAKMKTWLVYNSNGRLLVRYDYSEHMTKHEVYDDLVNYRHYDKSIVIVEQ